MTLNIDERISSLYRIRKTVFQMLRDRGYLVDDLEINMSKLDFKNKFGAQHINTKDLVIKTAIKDNSSDQIFAFFIDEPKVGVKIIKDYIDKMHEAGVFKAILVVQQKLSHYANKAISDLSSKFQLEVFEEAELLVNIKEHDLVPKHEVLTDAKKKTLLEKYTVKETQLPKMQVNDPIAKYYGLKKGQIVKITRPSETAGSYVTYRYVS